MKRLIATLLASGALAVPAFAAPNNATSQPPQPPQQTQQQPQTGSMKAPNNQAEQPAAKSKEQAEQPAVKSSKQAEQPTAKSSKQAANQIVEPNQLGRNQVRSLQVALNKEGFDAGHVDGIWGPQTRKAVQNFQQSKGIHTGQLTLSTLSDLGVQVDSNQLAGSRKAGNGAASSRTMYDYAGHGRKNK